MTVAQLYKRYIQPISAADQLELIALISRQLINRPERQQRSLLELEGLGAEIWEGVDPQQYVDALRNEWENRL
ncbi:Antitoxin VbhA domain-containing protein [Candidatus Electronema halotolerans]